MGNSGFKPTRTGLMSTYDTSSKGFSRFFGNKPASCIRLARPPNTAALQTVQQPLSRERLLLNSSYIRSINRWMAFSLAVLASPSNTASERCMLGIIGACIRNLSSEKRIPSALTGSENRTAASSTACWQSQTFADAQHISALKLTDNHHGLGQKFEAHLARHRATSAVDGIQQDQEGLGVVSTHTL
ncbi:hypothetical protein BDV06DRAFT_191439 [Aspergillus oleicola]